jgi:hypothetical protein
MPSCRSFLVYTAVAVASHTQSYKNLVVALHGS